MGRLTSTSRARQKDNADIEASAAQQVKEEKDQVDEEERKTKAKEKTEDNQCSKRVDKTQTNATKKKTDRKATKTVDTVANDAYKASDAAEKSTPPPLPKKLIPSTDINDKDMEDDNGKPPSKNKNKK